MAYTRDTWTFPDSIEHEYKYMGKYGAAGEKRAEKRKPTKEQIRKQNQWIREKLMRRLIKANFCPNDLWVTLKYPKGCRKPIGEVKKDLQKFLSRLRYEYKKRGEPLKYIYRIEIGKHGGIHIHILINRTRGKPDTDVLIQEKWTYGRANFESLYEQGGFQDLACYIVKLPDEEIEEQLSLFPEQDRKELIKYSCSRNLIRPEPVKKTYTHWTMRRILEEGPTPTKGYYIDKDSIICGINPVTGMSYLYYTEYPLRRERGQPPDG